MIEPFDPLSGLFVAQAHRPDELRPINLRALSPPQRALLVIDGTVTKFLEAYTMERIEVVGLGQTVDTLEDDNPWLDYPRGSKVLFREVLLRGAWSRTPFAYAVSEIAVERLPEEAQRKILDGAEGLGRILLSAQLETRREVLWCGRATLDELPAAIHQLEGRDFIVRTYRIIAGEQPLMVITEKFPAEIEHPLMMES